MKYQDLYTEFHYKKRYVSIETDISQTYTSYGWVIDAHCKKWFDEDGLVVVDEMNLDDVELTDDLKKLVVYQSINKPALEGADMTAVMDYEVTVYYRKETDDLVKFLKEGCKAKDIEL